LCAKIYFICDARWEERILIEIEFNEKMRKFYYFGFLLNNLNGILFVWFGILPQIKN
jgi:hypothetical protein